MTHHEHTHRHLDTENLRLLERMDDFRVAKGDPDIRGWEVFGKDGGRVGTVDHLIVDPSARRVRFLGIDVDRSLLPGRQEGDHVAVPIESARLDEDRHDRVRIPQTKTEITTLAVYHRGSIERMHGSRETTGRTGTAAPRGTTPTTGRETGRDEQKVTLAEEELAVGKREARAGEVEVEKKVERERVHEKVPVKHEEAVIERREARSGSTEAAFEKDEIRIPLMREEVVVDKRTKPKEEIVVKKREVTDEKVVDDTVRRERAEVHEKGGAEVRRKDEHRH